MLIYFSSYPTDAISFIISRYKLFLVPTSNLSNESSAFCYYKKTMESWLRSKEKVIEFSFEQIYLKVMYTIFAERYIRLLLIVFANLFVSD